jgi:WD40 repeat protein
MGVAMVHDASEPVDASAWIAARPGGVGAVAAWCAADGSRRLAASGTDGLIHVWDVDTREPVVVPGFQRPVHEPLIELVAWSGPDGVRLASAGGGSVRVWDPQTGNLVCPTLAGHTSWVSGLTVWTAPDGSSRLASASADGTVQVWDPQTGHRLGDPLGGHAGAVHDITSWILPDGSARLASVDNTGTIRVWSPDSGTVIGRVRTSQVSGLCSLASWVEPGGQILVGFGRGDGIIEVVDPDTGRTHSRLLGHHTWVHALTVWTDADGGVRLGSASMDGTIRIWDPHAGAPIGDPITGALTAGTHGGLAVWEGRDGRRCLASAANGVLRIWDAETRVLAAELSMWRAAALWALASWMTADGHPRLAAAGDDPSVRIWDAETGAELGQPLTGHTATVWTMTCWSDADGHPYLASAGDDGTIRRWDGEAIDGYGDPIHGHAGWIPSVAAWQAPDGTPLLASGGADGAIRIWDPHTGAAVGELDTSNTGCTWILALTTWSTPDGSTHVAFAGNNPHVYVWHPDDGRVDVLTVGYTDWIRALTTWTGGDGHRKLACGGVDGTIRIWDIDAGTTSGEPIAAHVGWVRALVTWADSNHQTLLASAGADDSTIRIWDPQTGTAVGQPLTGHQRGVWTLATWTASDGRTRLASTGPDGTVRLWDPQTGHAIRTIEVGPVTMWGLSDAATTDDLLDRRRLADAIADQLDRSARTRSSAPDGPIVVSIEGPWGSGKTSLMKLIRKRLSQRSAPSEPPPKAGHPLTIHEALRLVRQHQNRAAPTAEPIGDNPFRGIVTVWFNPWEHQSGEQIWAGLTHEIIEAAGSVLYPSEQARQRYWFTRNLARTDRYGLRRALHRRTLSPLFGVALAAVVAQLAIAVAELNKPFSVLGYTITAANLALGVSLAFLLVGGAHTAVRHLWSPAVHHLPAEIFHQPVSGTAIPDGATMADANTDPLHHARAGALYMYQHDIGDVITDLGNHGYDLVVFIDDIDRCRPATSVEVFEAVNLLLSGVVSRTSLCTHFVIGLDPQVVADHLDRNYEDTQRNIGDWADAPRPTPHGDDPSPGWAFLRKLIQLPVLVPHVPDGGIERFVDRVTSPNRPTTVVPAPTTPDPTPPTAAPRTAPPSPPPGFAHRPTEAVPTTPEPTTPVDIIPWRTLQQHPDVRATLIRRLAAQPDRSLREAKRLINVWQLYARLSAPLGHETQPGMATRRAEHLILLAEIVTRWPALQRPLHRHIDQRRGLQILADHAEDDAAWDNAVRQLGLNPARYRNALENLRQLLQEHDAHAIAKLADLLL